MALQDFAMYKLAPPLRDKTSQADSGALCPVIVECVGKATHRVTAKIEAGNGRIRREIGLIPAIAAELPLNALAELSRTVGIARIWEDTAVYAMLDRTGADLGANQAHESGYTGKGVVVAVLDTGVFPHLDLTTPENRILAWHDLVDNRAEPYDDHGHGTHLAGIIAGNGVSSHGRYCGIAPEARLVAVKVLDRNGRGRLSDLLAGLEWCLAHRGTLNIKVINLSLGTTAQAGYAQDPLCRAVAQAVQKGVVVCAAFPGGGYGSTEVSERPAARAAFPGGGYGSTEASERPAARTAFPGGGYGSTEASERPAARTAFPGGETGIHQGGYGAGNSPSLSPKTIAVGNYNGQKTLSGAEMMTYSKGGWAAAASMPDLTAPGTDVTSLSPAGDYQALSGASVAASLVTGAIALMLQKWPSLQPERIKGLLQKNARDLGIGVNLQGAGLLGLNEIFGLTRKKPAKTEAARGSADELLRLLFSLMGQNTAAANPGGELLKNIILTMMKGIK